MSIRWIGGGVCAPGGFLAAGMHAGIRKNKEKKDLALVVADRLCTAAAVYTTNLVKGAPLGVTKSNLANGRAQAVICNSGNANTCNADGREKAEEMCRLTAQAAGICAQDVIVASTGVIGQTLPIEPIRDAMPALAARLRREGGTDAAQAILTTDTIAKEYALAFEMDGCTVQIGGMAKGSGMIHPNMATMLGFLTTDAAVPSKLLDRALHAAVQKSFNRVSVDGDTSTNDMVSILASGQAGNAEIRADSEEYAAFEEALTALCVRLARELAKDGEGATKLVVAQVRGAATGRDAEKIAMSVIQSPLVKSAMFGADANWGRVLCAIGYAGAQVDVGAVQVAFSSEGGRLSVCENGAGIAFSEETAKRVLSHNEVVIEIRLGDGDAEAEAFGCDLSYEYVRINGEYRT